MFRIIDKKLSVQIKRLNNIKLIYVKRYFFKTSVKFVCKYKNIFMFHNKSKTWFIFHKIIFTTFIKIVSYILYFDISGYYRRIILDLFVLIFVFFKIHNIGLYTDTVISLHNKYLSFSQKNVIQYFLINERPLYIILLSGEPIFVFIKTSSRLRRTPNVRISFRWTSVPVYYTTD